MSKDKSVVPDTPGVYAPYPSFDNCVAKVAALIEGTGLGYYQYIHTAPTHVAIETVLIHDSGEELSTGEITIPLSKADAQGIAVAIGWAKRLSLVNAFSLGTKELPAEEQQALQNQKLNQTKTLESIEL